MIRLSTSSKLRIARTLKRIVTLSRTVAGRPTGMIRCKRKGIHWNLDLSEGIDFAIYLCGAFERGSAASMERILRPGMIVLDIGANIGAHALPIARKVSPGGRVYAIEPTDFAFSKLRENLDLNSDLMNVLIPVKAALVEPQGHLPERFYSSWQLDSSHEQHPVHGGSLQEVKNASSFTLDEFTQREGITQVDFIKMDVDGYESMVLKGASETLRRNRPPILIELCPYVLEEHGSSLRELIELLDQYGYDLFSENGARKLSKNIAQLNAQIPKNGGINALAIATNTAR